MQLAVDHCRLIASGGGLGQAVTAGRKKKKRKVAEAAAALTAVQVFTVGQEVAAKDNKTKLWWYGTVTQIEGIYIYVDHHNGGGVVQFEGKHAIANTLVPINTATNNAIIGIISVVEPKTPYTVPAYTENEHGGVMYKVLMNINGASNPCVVPERWWFYGPAEGAQTRYGARLLLENTFWQSCETPAGWLNMFDSASNSEASCAALLKSNMLLPAPSDTLTPEWTLAQKNKTLIEVFKAQGNRCKRCEWQGVAQNPGMALTAARVAELELRIISGEEKNTWAHGMYFEGDHITPTMWGGGTRVTTSKFCADGATVPKQRSNANLTTRLQLR